MDDRSLSDTRALWVGTESELPLIRKSCAFGGAGRVVVASMILVIASTSQLLAEDASRWNGDGRAAVRLIAGTAQQEGGTPVLRAGVELKLGSGWKVYWRYPGDAGVPPRFDFAGSKNVADIAVLWPGPMRFSEDGTHLIVYKDHVVLPLRIVPADPLKAVTIQLKLDYGICEKFCILAEAKAKLTLSGGPSAHESALAAAERRVPRKADIGERDGLSVLAIRREHGTNPSRMVVDIAAPDGASVDLFAEGPTSDWALPVPQQISEQPGLRRFVFELNGVPPGIDPTGAALRLTAVTAEQAIEVFAAVK